MWSYSNPLDVVSIVFRENLPTSTPGFVRSVRNLSARPNPAHLALATLQAVKAIITQNIDDLHQQSRRIRALHIRRPHAYGHLFGSALGLTLGPCGRR